MLLALAAFFLIVAIVVWDIKARRSWNAHQTDMAAARGRIADAIKDANRK